jgi:hypothetical protein
VNRCLTPRQQELVDIAGNLHARKIIGASALGVELAPAIGFDETGPDSRAAS